MLWFFLPFVVDAGGAPSTTDLTTVTCDTAALATQTDDSATLATVTCD